MSFNRVGTPTFYIDAVLLARQWGAIQYENTQGKFKLNPYFSGLSSTRCQSYLEWLDETYI